MKRHGMWKMATLGLVACVCFGAWYTYPISSDVDTAFVRGEILFVSAQHPGNIVALKCDEGDVVAAGALIAEVRSVSVADSATTTQSEYLEGVRQQSDLQRQFNLQRIKLQQLNQTLALAKKQAETAQLRHSNLAHNDSVSIEEKTNAELRWRKYESELIKQSQSIEQLLLSVEHIKAALQQQNGQIKVLRQRRDLWRNALADLHLRTPRSMVVMRRHVTLGNSVNAGDPICQGVMPGSMWVDAYLTDEQVQAVTLGDIVDVSNGEFRVNGVISGISPATGSALSQDTPNYTSGHVLPLIQRTPVRITLPPSIQDKWRVGQRVKVTL